VNSSQVEYNNFLAVSSHSASSNFSSVALNATVFVQYMEKLYEDSLSKLKTLSEQTHKSDAEIRQLEEDILALRQKL
jgi:hypothetical protein